jgi:hypothetical protein
MKPLALWLLMQSLSTTPGTQPPRLPLTPCKTCFVVQQPRRHPVPPRPRNGRGVNH